MSARRFPWGLTITVIIALGILVSLGVWQLYRLQWKEGVLARRAALEHAQARPLDAVLASYKIYEHADMVRVTVTCPGLATAPVQRVYSLADGRVVNRLVSVCRHKGQPRSGLAAAYPNPDDILVDRGRVPEGMERPPVVDASNTEPVTITGVLRLPQEPNFIARLITPAPPALKPGQSRLWMTYDLPEIGAALGAPNPARVFIAAETSTNPDWPDLTPGLPTAEIPNNHLQYAFTWFGLALVLVFIYAAMLQKRLKS